MTQDKQSFWDHLDILRAAIIRIAAVTVLFTALLTFAGKEALFHIILAPQKEDFITYRLLNIISKQFTGSELPAFSIHLINTGLTGQILLHMKTALFAGILCTSPYILYQMFRFISPALYHNEKKYALRMIACGYMMFIGGILLSYYLIFPLTFRFLGTYQVSDAVQNMITLQSYISTLLTLSLTMGIVFEMPVLSWLFARLGFLSADFMRHYRKHAVVVILIVAAIITPTSDIFTLSLVAFPIWLLYEVSILLVQATSHKSVS